MSTCTVIAVDHLREVFVLQAETGECAVCWVLAGPVIHTGDRLTGDMRHKGHLELEHLEGRCCATGESGLVTRAQAMLILHDGREYPTPDLTAKAHAPRRQ